MNQDEKNTEKLNILESNFIKLNGFGGKENEHEESDQYGRGGRFPSPGTGRKG